MQVHFKVSVDMEVLTKYENERSGQISSKASRVFQSPSDGLGTHEIDFRWTLYWPP